MYIIHRVYKEFQNWSEATVDCLALSLYHLQIFYLNKVKSGMSGSGQYQLSEKYEHLKADYHAYQCVNVGSPEDIVKSLRNGSMFESGELKGNDHSASLNASSCSNYNEPKCVEPEGDIREDSDTNPYLQSFEKKRADEIDSLKPNISKYLLACAYLVSRNQNITYDTKFGCFIVKQPKEVARVVTLFPKVKCTCQPTSECYHILAVKINLGMNVTETTKVKNLTKLRKNNKKRKGGRSGRKRP